MKLSKQVANDAKTSNVPNVDGLKALDHTELRIQAISKANSSNKLFR